MKSSSGQQAAKQLEEALVKEALVGVYQKYALGTPQEVSLELSSYVQKLRHGLHQENLALRQDLCLALFAGADVMPALRGVVSKLPMASSIKELLTTLRKQVHLNISFWERLRFAVSAFLSSKTGSVCFGRVAPFDPRCFAKNIGGRFKRETIGRPMSWLVGATPTVGDHLSKEASLAIEALRNGQSVFPYGLWVYCNLQSTKSFHEGGRSQGLLEASHQNIDHFRVASLSVDNPWYRSHHDKPLIQHRHFIEKELNAAIQGQASWYAFAIKDDERDEWTDWVGFVVDEAFAMAQETKSSIVFQELVLLGIIRAWQGFCMRN